MAGSLTGSALARSGVNAEERVTQNIGLPRNVGPGRVTIPGSGPGGLVRWAGRHSTVPAGDGADELGVVALVLVGVELGEP